MEQAAYEWDFFLAHAGADSAAAETLYNLLTPHSKVFLDSRCLLPGDDWDQELSIAQGRSLVTIVLVSSRTDGAYYQREEIACAIDMARKDKSRHRVVPVFLDGRAAESAMPYGLRLKHGLYVSSVEGLDAAAQRLKDLLARIQGDGPAPAAQAETSAPAPKARQESYKVIHTIHEGHYSRALKCRIQETGEFCVLKETAASRVDVKALHALKELGCANVAAPRAIWEEGGMVYEELPYVGGVRLSSTVAPRIGGLTGSVLESFHDQLMRTLGEMHAAQIIHRDVHPDNIYLVIHREGADSTRNKDDAKGPWSYDHFGYGDSRFLLAWVLVDCTFATLISESGKSRYRHGSYTPEEQETGAACPASDMYAFGATLYYGITGREIPPFRVRYKDPESLDYPSGGHPSVGFPHYLERLLAFDAGERPAAPYSLSPDSVAPGYTGTLQLSDKEFLAADHFNTETRILAGRDAVAFYEGQSFYSPEEQYSRVDYWIDLLKSKGFK